MKPYRNTPETFWNRVDKKNQCWTWTGAVSQSGYGTLGYQGKSTYAHILAYKLTYGDIPEERPCILHKCDNPKCCNPDHLFAGTKAENSLDMKNKGRSTHGNKNPNSKLSADDILSIRKRLENGERQKDIASSYGVDASTISYIHRRKTWGLIA